MKIEENVSLKELTTFKIGGPARFFCVVSDTEDLREAVSFVERKNIPLFILGGGSNVLIADGGFPGLVAKLEIKGIFFETEENGEVLATAGAGENWDEFVGQSVSMELFGLENLSGIPGSVGATPVQNVGAYGVEVKDTIHRVEVFDRTDSSFKVFSNSDCRFGYRDSIFKTAEGKRYIITRVTFKLKKKGHPSLDYKDIKSFFEEKGIKEPKLREIREAIISIRGQKFPDLREMGTAGSFFKNVFVSGDDYSKMLLKHKDIPGFKMPDGKVKIPLGWILENICNLKGARTGSVGLFPKQSLVMVNYSGSTASEVQKFADEVKKAVKEKFGVDIEQEVQYVE